MTSRQIWSSEISSVNPVSISPKHGNHPRRRRRAPQPTGIQKENMSKSTPCNTDRQPEASSTVFRDAEQFLAEWYDASQRMSADRRSVLEKAVMQGLRTADVALDSGINRERARQHTEKAIEHMRKATDANPQGELAKVRDALIRISEADGITIWEFHRLGDRARQEITALLINVGAVTTEEYHLVPPASCLVPQPGKGHHNLDRAARTLRRFLLNQAGGVTPETAFKIQQPSHPAMKGWPHLE